MQTSISSRRRERTSSEVDEILQSRLRRQTSANLGKTHFKLAKGLLSSPPTSSNSYPDNVDDAWRHYSTYANHLAAATSYDDAWSRHHGSVGTSKSVSDACPTIFENVPRSITRPIMSRLPLEVGEQDIIAAEPTKAGKLDYLMPFNDSATHGVHSDVNVAQDATYTRARLPEIDDESVHLWQSLHDLRNLSDAYADGYGAQARRKGNAIDSAPPHPIAADMNIDDCPAFALSTSSSSRNALALVQRIFNWNELPDLPTEDENVWYGVAFRSKRKVGSESINLYEADRRSHEEAVNSGGLLMYWYGVPNLETGHNLATCVWTNRQDAIRASSLPLHARAAAHASKAYESFELHRYALRKVKGESKLRVEEWTE